MKIKKVQLPRIGQRIFKSVIGVFLCFMIYVLRGHTGEPFYSCLAVLWCIRPYAKHRKMWAAQRIIGTFVGAITGLLLLVNRERLIWGSEWIYYIAIAGGIIITIYITLLLNKKNASYFACVVYLSVVVKHIGDSNPYVFVVNRVIDTLIGIGLAILIDVVRLPRRKEKDTLFISGIDDVLLDEKHKLSAYSQIELNRMIEEGAMFTVASMRTPADLMETLGEINLQIPVIAMNGAVLYDTNEKKYLRVYVLSEYATWKIKGILDGMDIGYFTNVIVDDCLLIYHSQWKDEIQKKDFEKRRKSPYRNYIEKSIPEQTRATYFMILEKQSKIDKIMTVLKQYEITEKCRVITYPSEDYTGYAYIKIYNRNASRKNQIDYLKQLYSVEHVVTFGSIPHQCDVLTEEHKSDFTVRQFRKLFEPVIWKKYTQKGQH